MDKATFLVQLQKNIGMLDDGEQKDIIDEYAQHIDMKVSGGMTEAEAIEDFGDFNEFVREVLSAYHVKAPFDQAPFDQAATAETAATASPTPGDRLDDAMRAGASAVEKAAAATKSGAHKIGERVSGAFGKAAERVRTRPLRAEGAQQGRAPSGAADEERFEAAQAEGGPVGAEGPRRSTGGLRVGFVAAWRFCRDAAKTLVRWAWNAFVACCAAFCLIMGLASVFCFGICAVFLAQGYPMLGLTVAGVGAAMTFGAGSYLLAKLIVRRPSDEKAAGRKADWGGGAVSQPPMPSGFDGDREGSAFTDEARPAQDRAGIATTDDRFAGASSFDGAAEELGSTRPMAFSAWDRRFASARRGISAPGSLFSATPLRPAHLDTMPLGNKGGVWHD